jgi:hypothetical protein
MSYYVNKDAYRGTVRAMIRSLRDDPPFDKLRDRRKKSSETRRRTHSETRRRTTR